MRVVRIILPPAREMLARLLIGIVRLYQRLLSPLVNAFGPVAFLAYFLRRLSLVIPTLVGVTLITFTLTYLFSEAVSYEFSVKIK